MTDLEALEAEELDLPLTGNERHKGFVEDYTPRKGSDRDTFMDEAKKVIKKYAKQNLRLTNRAIAYKVAANLGRGHDVLDSIEDALVMLKRTKRIRMYATTDGRTKHHELWTADEHDAAEYLRNDIATLHHDRQADQPWRVVLLVEAAGMMPIVEATVDEYGVRVVSGSGSVPLPAVHKIATTAADWWRMEKAKTAVLVITDFDLAGLQRIYVPFRRDLKAFAAGYGTEVHVRRIIATPQQIAQHIPEELRQPAPAERCGQCTACTEVRPKGAARKACPRPRVVSWWPILPGVEPFSLPAAEALVDQIPGILRTEFDRYLTDAEARAALVADEPEKRKRAAEELARLLAEDDE